MDTQDLGNQDEDRSGSARGFAGHRRALLGAMAACAAPAWTAHAAAADATHAGGTATANGEGEGEGGWFSAFGLRMKVEVATASTGGAMSTTRVVSTPGSGPPAHLHTREDEVFVILRGRYRFWQAGGPAIDAAPGALVRQHRGVVHQYRNVGDDEGEHLLICLPGGLEALFVAVAREGLVAPRDMRRIVELSARHGLTYTAPLAP